MAKFVVRREFSYIRDGAAVHHSNRMVGQVIILDDDDEATALMESGCLEPVAKPTAQEAQQSAPADEVEETPVIKRRRGRTHNDD